MKAPTPIEERFYSKVLFPRDHMDCWLWNGAIDPQTGYGRIGLGGRKSGVANAHRLSYLLAYEFIADGLIVCHQCNNKRCVNPRHLYAGTHSDNLKQAYNDGLRQPRKGANQ